jgi:glyoxylate/hydroxypyruvate reductase
MSLIIPFVSQLDAEEERIWLEALSQAMPQEQIVSFNELDASVLATAPLAIVANPKTSDIARMPNLVWVHSVWAGVEKLMEERAKQSFAIVRLVDPELSRTMAEAVAAWTLYLHRDMPAYAMQQMQRVWQPLPYRRPAQCSIGFIGFGELGQASAVALQYLGFPVMAWSRTPKGASGVETFQGDDGLARMLNRSDIAICLLPLTRETRGLVDGDFFTSMRPGASFINFARGPIVVTDDLLAALDSGHLKHAVLDVFDTEPLPAHSPFWGHPKVTVLPHISAPTNPATAARVVATNIGTYRTTGEIPAPVSRERGY